MPPRDSNPKFQQLNGRRPIPSSQSLTKINKLKRRTFQTILSNAKFRCFQVKCVLQTCTTWRHLRIDQMREYMAAKGIVTSK
jgi:hypothetical protein